jgi:DNA polymerase-3 subunit delta
MPHLEPQQLYSQVEKAVESGGDFAPLYFFHGEEPYLIQQALQYLKACVVEPASSDFNFTSYYAADVSITQVCDEVETLPMMAQRRMVLLKEVQDLSDKEWAQLETLFVTPVVSTVFVLVGHKIDKRKKFFRILSEQASAVEFKKPYENQIPGWIRHIAKAHSLTISDEALQLFHRLVGSQLLEIESEIKKLRDFIGVRKQIELEDVAQSVSKKREENVFDFCESIANGDKVESLIHLVQLLDQGQSELGIVQLLARHIRILMVIKQGIEQNMSGQKLAALAQVPSYYLQDYLNQSKRWSFKKLEQVLVILSETDRALKTSPISSHIWLENMVLKIC